jgi:hypothetical protein
MTPLISNAHFQLWVIAFIFGLSMVCLVFWIVLALFQQWLESRNWRRFVRANGSDKNAMLLLEQLERINHTHTDSTFRRGMKYARMRKWI